MQGKNEYFFIHFIQKWSSVSLIIYLPCFRFCESKIQTNISFLASQKDSAPISSQHCKTEKKVICLLVLVLNRTCKVWVKVCHQLMHHNKVYLTASYSNLIVGVNSTIAILLKHDILHFSVVTTVKMQNYWFRFDEFRFFVFC